MKSRQATKLITANRLGRWKVNTLRAACNRVHQMDVPLSFIIFRCFKTSKTGIFVFNTERVSYDD